jgi:hypothetical protein
VVAAVVVSLVHDDMMRVIGQSSPGSTHIYLGAIRTVCKPSDKSGGDTSKVTVQSQNENIIRQSNHVSRKEKGNKANE